MNKELLKQLILSDKSFLSIAKVLKCSVDEFTEKILGNQPLNGDDVSLLINFVPMEILSKIFFDNNVSEIDTVH